MISVICVYNNNEVYNNILCKSLKEQTNNQYELIGIDNTEKKFNSAASALNYGASIANGDILIFLHQDMELPPKTLQLFEEYKDKYKVAGVIGVDTNFKCVGQINGNEVILGERITKPEIAQTLDECLIAIKKELFDLLKFDEKTFDGWHCYGADYCLEAKIKFDINTVVLPIYTYHRTKKINTKGLSKYKFRLLRKHRKDFSIIATSTGKVDYFHIITQDFSSIVIYEIYRRIFPLWLDDLKKEMKGCETVIDLGCGYNSPIQICNNIKYSVGVDNFIPYIEESKSKKIHNEYIVQDLKKIDIDRKYDAVFSSEVLEHLSKDESEKMLEKAIKIASKKVIITTPNGYVEQHTYDENEGQNHLCGWTVKELKNKEFRVIGMGGLKYLHNGHQGKLKYKPKFIWARIDDICGLITRNVPELAFQLFAVKDIKDK